MKILAFYLPQFHEIPENNQWWGKGYTEWDAVRNARKYYKRHKQPRIPLDNNYYDLSDDTGSVWKWQASLAKKYGVYGFCIYHYWFSTGNQLLEKPMEILLSHPEIDINYCVCWANETWKRTWYSANKEILKKQLYGDQNEWENHFRYLLKFFKDTRYIKVNNKPVVNIYHTFEIENLDKMRKFWDMLAKKNGFDGIYLIAGNTASGVDNRFNLIDAYYNYEPMFSFKIIRKCKENKIKFLMQNIGINVRKIKNNIFTTKTIPLSVNAKSIYPYITEKTEINGKKCYLGTFVSYDDTPRRQYKGMEIKSTPDLFYESLLNIKEKLKLLNRNDDFVYVTAWNEWGEGAYLEPDMESKYSWLEKIKKIHDEE